MHKQPLANDENCLTLCSFLKRNSLEMGESAEKEDMQTQGAPAMGVRHEPSKAVRKARSQATAMRVSSWFSRARYSCEVESFERQAIPMAPCAQGHQSPHGQQQRIQKAAHQSYGTRCFSWGWQRNGLD